MKKFLFLLLPLLLLTACANPGSGPDGGPYDETPPRLVKLSPELGATGLKARKVVLTFDELIKVENAQEKVIVSPPQIEMPEIKTSGRSISVELLDTLRENTTYTIDFSDAIVDATEGNPLGRFTYYYSTGADLDTMEVSGYVVDAETLEPVKGILVGLYPATAPDSCFRTQPFLRVARTDGGGRFSVKGVKQGSYRAYALKDMDGDFRWSRGEQLAFSTAADSFRTSSYPDVRYDTLWVDTVRYDTIVTVPFTHYLPETLVLRAFSEVNTQRMLLKTEREPEWFRLYFTAPSEELPKLRGLNFDASNLTLEASRGRDTLTYYLRDTTLYSVDSLLLELRYDCSYDTLPGRYLRTDTLELVPRLSWARRAKMLSEEVEKWEKQQEKRLKKGNYKAERSPAFRAVGVKVAGSTSLTPTSAFIFDVTEPLATLDTTKVTLWQKVDTNFVQRPFRLEQRPEELMRYRLTAEWEAGQRYVLNVDSAAFCGLSKAANDAFDKEISVRSQNEMGAVFFLLPGVDTTAVVQVLDNSGTKVLREERVKNGRADFFYMEPGHYYFRLFIDRNGNGRWDTGSFDEGRQPEEVYYFSQGIDVRANWDVEQTWRPTELPLYKQKPNDLVKQRADKEKTTARGKNEQRERDKR